MRLIDVNKLNECLFIHKGKICPNRDIDNFPITMTVEDVKSAISKQPTAYDVDKVVEKLEKRRMEALRHLRENKGAEFGYASECVYNALNEAVEIVEGGGVDG